MTTMHGSPNLVIPAKAGTRSRIHPCRALPWVPAEVYPQDIETLVTRDASLILLWTGMPDWRETLDGLGGIRTDLPVYLLEDATDGERAPSFRDGFRVAALVDGEIPILPFLIEAAIELSNVRKTHRMEKDALIRQLLDLRDEQERIEQQAAAAEVYTGIAKRKAVSIRIPETEFVVVGDRGIIETVLRNLLNNAIKFTHRGGAVTLSFEEAGDTFRITIADNGVGMTPERVADFNNGLLVQGADGTGGESGTGLGLSICQEMIAKYGGVLAPRSEVGRGSAFSFDLPRAVA
jgi:signal transduction histidine kinase